MSTLHYRSPLSAGWVDVTPPQYADSLFQHRFGIWLQGWRVAAQGFGLGLQDFWAFVGTGKHGPEPSGRKTLAGAFRCPRLKKQRKGP